MSSVKQKVLKQKALQGDAEAQFQLGTHPIEINSEGRDEIIYWLTKASEQDHYRAQTNLGMIYYFGDLGVQSYEKSFKLFKKASELGDVSAVYYMGLSLQQGQGVKRDLTAGFKHLLNASKSGMPHAQLSVAQSYEDGTGVEKDLFQAVSWYAYAAKGGLEEASDNFNRLYYFNAL